MVGQFYWPKVGQNCWPLTISQEFVCERRSLKQFVPSLADFHVGPVQALSFVDMQHDMVVVAHYSVGADVNGKDLSERQNAIFDPLPPMFIGVAGIFIFSAEKCPADAARHAVVIGSSV